MTDQTSDTTGSPQSQRIDKWLWHARFARTRTAAQQLAVSGHVRVNRRRVSAASRTVRPGDVLTLVIGRTVRVITILAIADRRGSAQVAKSLYEDRAPELTISAKRASEGDRDASVRSERRPDKRERQRILAMKRKQF